MPTTLYTVRPGDSLWTIAEKFGTTVNDIARYNGISDTDLIYPGQQLRIYQPGTPPVPPNNVPEWYVVREGDTLGNIASRFGTTVEQLQWLNSIDDPNLIYPRQRLRIRP